METMFFILIVAILLFVIIAANRGKVEEKKNIQRGEVITFESKESKVNKESADEARDILEYTDEYLGNDEYRRLANIAGLEYEDEMWEELKTIEDDDAEEWLQNEKEIYGFVSNKVYEEVYRKKRKADVDLGRRWETANEEGSVIQHYSQLTHAERQFSDEYFIAEDAEQKGNIIKAVDNYKKVAFADFYLAIQAQKRILIIYEKEKMYSELIDFCEKCLNVEKTDRKYVSSKLYKTLYRMGRDAEKQLHYENSILYYEKVCRNFPIDGAFERLVIVYRKLNRLEDEIEICRHYLSLKNKSLVKQTYFAERMEKSLKKLNK